MCVQDELIAGVFLSGCLLAGMFVPVLEGFYPFLALSTLGFFAEVGCTSMKLTSVRRRRSWHRRKSERRDLLYCCSAVERSRAVLVHLLAQT